jgi:hypothetical protein
MTDHTHDWRVHSEPDKLRCIRRGCNTVSPIDIAIANAEATAAHQMKVTILNNQLFKRELKKPAHDAAYAWLIAHSETQQEALL